MVHLLKWSMWVWDLTFRPGASVIKEDPVRAFVSGSDHRKEETQGQVNENIPPASSITECPNLWPSCYCTRPVSANNDRAELFGLVGVKSSWTTCPRWSMMINHIFSRPSFTKCCNYTRRVQRSSMIHVTITTTPVSVVQNVVLHNVADMMNM